MSGQIIPAEDRLDILDLLGRYLFAVDTGDLECVLACFAEDGVVRYATGETFAGAEGLREFARKAIGGPETRGRMHLNFPLYFARRGDAIVLTSYLSTAQWKPPAPPQSFGSIRYIEDHLVKTPAGWRMKERVIALWSADTIEDIAARAKTTR